MDPASQAAAERIETLASSASYVSATTATTYGLFTLQEWVALAGLALGAATFAVNWYYKRAMYVLRIAAEERRAAGGLESRHEAPEDSE